MTIYVYADIETDRLRADKILQISAVSSKGEKFNTYVNPHCALPLSTTNFNGFYFYHGHLYRNGAALPAVEVRTALERFREWLEGLQEEVTLIFHNGFSFDCYALARFYLKYRISFPKTVKNTIDTLPAFRKYFKTAELQNHKLCSLALFFGISTDNAHDALSDSIMLKDSCEKASEQLGIPLESFLEGCSRPFCYFLEKEKIRMAK